MQPNRAAERETTLAKSIQASQFSSQAASNVPFVEQYLNVRRFTEHLCEPLVTEDYVIQSIPDVSPAKWHLAHVSWFFETFLLFPAVPDYRSLHPQYAYLLNSWRGSMKGSWQSSRPSLRLASIMNSSTRN